MNTKDCKNIGTLFDSLRNHYKEENSNINSNSDCPENGESNPKSPSPDANSDCPEIGEFKPKSPLPDANLDAVCNFGEIVNVLNNPKHKIFCVCFKCWACLLPILTIIALIVLLFIPLKCSSQTAAVTINSTKTDIPIYISDSCKNSFVFAKKIIVDSTYVCSPIDTTASKKEDETSIHSEIVYQSTRWHIYAYRVVFAIIILFTCIMALKYLLPFWSRLTERKLSFEEQIQKDAIRLFDEDREYRRLHYKTELGLYEKREKAKIDDWVREKEHRRALEKQECERISELSKILVDLARTKNTITFEKCGKKVSIERSILSCDCCEELKDVISNYLSKDNCCCETIRKVLECFVCKDGELDCNKLKRLLKSLLCDDCEGNKVLITLIEKLISVLDNKNCAGSSCNVHVSNN